MGWIECHGGDHSKQSNYSTGWFSSCTVFAIWTWPTTFFYWFWTLCTFRPTFRSDGMDDLWKPLVRAFFNLRLYSTWWFWWIHLRGLFYFPISFGSACMGFSSRPIRWWIYFLSSVISMVAPTWCHGPTWGDPSWENVDRFDNRIDTVNLVIHLSKGKQSALLRVSPVGRRLLNNWPLSLAITFCRNVQLTAVEPPLFQLCSSDQTRSYGQHDKVPGHAWKYGASSLLVLLVRLTHLCTQFGRFVSCYRPLWGGPTSIP